MKRLGILIMVLSLFFTLQVRGASTATNQVLEDIEALEAKEQETATNLYALEQEIQKKNRDLVELQDQIEIMTQEISGLTINQKIMEEKHQITRTQLGRVLTVYQKRGGLTMLDTLMQSDSLKDFLNRLSILREFTFGTRRLLDQIETEASAIRDQLEFIEKRKADLANEEAALVVAIDALNLSYEAQEEALESLADERAKYQEILEGMRASWEALTQVFPKTGEAFTALAESGSLPEEALSLGFGKSGIEASIAEADFNKAIRTNKVLENLVFDFKTDEIVLSLEDYGLILYGNFIVENDRVLIFEAASGTFMGAPLVASSIEELFIKGPLTLDLTPLTGKNKIKKVRSEKNLLVLEVMLSLF